MDNPLINWACDGDLPESYFRQKLTIGEAMRIYEGQSQSIEVLDSGTAE
ncbi:hypothetical protein [Paenibacillus ehimensis]|uniref:Uncharacterized protein n=1 Tax=Paenibacillus ehimensis TaxID=79264 RepID=A0ABT8VHH6_9BACL|nr:hypothetical protein [Paenibacillus ehimensis]MDO3680401.1 hypothetical protein [Paenibacillus ehimensis]